MCIDLSNCKITEINYLNWLPDARVMPLLDTLTLYELKNIDNGYDDYFYYANNHTYCIKDSSLLLIKETKIWDEKIDKNLIYFYIPIMDDSYLIRIRKVFGSFFVVDVFEDLSDAMFGAVVNRGCRSSQ